MVLWETAMWSGSLRRFDVDVPRLTTLYIDVGAHEWSRYLPRLREEPDAVLVCAEPSRAAFLELYRRAKMDYSDLLPRIILLPIALVHDPSLSWGRRRVRLGGLLSAYIASHALGPTVEPPSNLFRIGP